jgi:cytochrome c-type biogenesis protein CcmH
MMFAFVLIAGSLAAGAAVLLLLPLMRQRPDARPAAGLAAGVVLLALLFGGAGLYALLSNYTWVDAPSVADTPAAMAAKLAKRLAAEPDNLDGWLMLGRTYSALEQFPLAVRAYQRADRIAAGRNVEAIIGMAESLLATDFDQLRSGAGRLFERALVLEPNNPKALLYGAFAALSHGESATARDRFTRMLAFNPPPQIREIIQKQLSILDAGGSPGQGAAASEARIDVHVTVDSKLRYKLGPNAALFVLARDPANPGPPFAAKRLPLSFPLEVTLTGADAMLPSRRITAGQTLEVVARISMSGTPQSASGDPFGQVSYHVGKDGRLNIVIDRLAP